MYYREWREYADSHQSGRQAFIDSFERWYSKLPHYIRHDAQESLVTFHK